MRLILSMMALACVAAVIRTEPLPRKVKHPLIKLKHLPLIDVCKLPKKVGPCRARFKRYYYNYETGLCTNFNFGGCRSNGNNFNTKRDCTRRCGCRAPAKTGRCYAAFKRYYYKNGNCHRFIYGGCGKNENNFSTKLLCMKTCNGSHIPRLPLCNLPRNRGRCGRKRASKRRFYFDKKCKCCRSFWYKGCGGNKNNFKKVTDCEIKCNAVPF